MYSLSLLHMYMHTTFLATTSLSLYSSKYITYCSRDNIITLINHCNDNNIQMCSTLNIIVDH